MPKAYYNEIDPYCAGWLRNLIAANLIAPGDVDERPIQDVTPAELTGYTQHHFFAGLGGWSFALREAAWPDHREVWTGSCPCQPFSAAGKRGGFADERHLWPYWQYLIEQCRPQRIFGEQVASAAEWLRLVRGDLEALGYAVGCYPVEAASAGADHLRDRYWFVAHHEHAREGRGRLFGPGEGSPAAGERTSDQFAGSGSDFSGRLADARGGRRAEPHQRQDQFPRRAETVGAGNGVGLADAHGAGFQERECDGRVQCETLGASERQAVECDGVADPHVLERRFGDFEPAGQFPQQQQHSEARFGSDLGHSGRAGAGRDSSSSPRTQAAGEPQRLVDGSLREPAQLADSAADFEWAIGADGKQRRVKPGVRLLADGVPNRISKLRALGNAIDHRPAKAFIQAACEALSIT